MAGEERSTPAGQQGALGKRKEVGVAERCWESGRQDEHHLKQHPSEVSITHRQQAALHSTAMHYWFFYPAASLSLTISASHSFTPPDCSLSLLLSPAVTGKSTLYTRLQPLLKKKKNEVCLAMSPLSYFHHKLDMHWHKNWHLCLGRLTGSIECLFSDGDTHTCTHRIKQAGIERDKKKSSREKKLNILNWFPFRKKAYNVLIVEANATDEEMGGWGIWEHWTLNASNWFPPFP